MAYLYTQPDDVRTGTNRDDERLDAELSKVMIDVLVHEDAPIPPIELSERRVCGPIGRGRSASELFDQLLQLCRFASTIIGPSFDELGRRRCSLGKRSPVNDRVTNRFESQWSAPWFHTKLAQRHS